MSEPAEWGESEKSGDCRARNHTESHAEKNSLFEKQSNSIKRKRGVSNPNWGCRRGYGLAFYFAELSIYAGYKPSFKRFHTDHMNQGLSAERL